MKEGRQEERKEGRLGEGGEEGKIPNGKKEVRK
jgi:hypothetical protein